MLTKETLEEIRRNRITANALRREIKAGGYYDGVHGIDYGRERVSGSPNPCDLTDVVMRREEERKQAAREWIMTMDKLYKKLPTLFSLVSLLSQSREISWGHRYAGIIWQYYAKGLTTIETARKLGISARTVKEYRAPAVRALLALAEEQAAGYDEDAG